MLVRFTNYAKVNCFWEKKILLFMLIQCVVIAILRWKGLSKLIINGKSLKNMEVDTLHDTSDAICN